jgi:hypothetical protein
MMIKGYLVELKMWGIATPAGQLVSNDFTRAEVPYGAGVYHIQSQWMT